MSEMVNLIIIGLVILLGIIVVWVTEKLFKPRVV